MFRKRTAFLAATAVALTIAGTASAAGAVTVPPWEPDPNSQGSVAFYDASGNVVTGGSDLSHLFDYAVASSASTRTTIKAQTTFAFPDHTKADSTTWFQAQSSAASNYPNLAAPAPINGFTVPVATVAPTAANLQALLSTTNLDSTAGYANIVQIRLKDSGVGLGNGVLASPFWETDISFDQAAGTWTQVYPAPIPSSTTTLAVTPNSPTALGLQVGLTATVTPSTGAGTVQFKDNGVALNSPVDVVNGAASTTSTSLTPGSHSLTAQFTPTDPSLLLGSTSAAQDLVVATAPGAPASVTTQAGNTTIAVSWTAPADTGGSPVTGYDVQYAANGGPFVSASPSSTTSTATSHVFTGLTNGVSYVFEVAAINGVGTGPHAFSPATVPVADPSLLTIGAPVAVRYATNALVSARLMDAVTRGAIGTAPTVLFRRANSSSPWSVVRVLTTSSIGTVSLSVPLRGTTQFFFRYGGSAVHKPVNSPVRVVAVSQTVAVSRSAASVRHRATVKIYGTVTPPGTGQRVYLQRYYGRAWHTLSSATIRSQRLPNGRITNGYVLPIKLTSVTLYTFRVYKPATSTLNAGFSGATSVRAT